MSSSAAPEAGSAPGAAGRVTAGGGPVLEVDDLEVGYGVIQVLFGVSVEVGAGEQVALLGTNGAGKSTLLRAVAGSLTPRAGRINFDGDNIVKLSADERVRRGLVLVNGGRSMFPTLSVLDNLRMGSYELLGRRAAVTERVDEVVTLFPELASMLGKAAGLLSGGEQQMVALGRGLMRRPRLLMVDELTLGLAPVVVGRLLEAMRRVTGAGTSLLLVEQSLNVALALAERAYFLEKGAVVYAGPTAELAERGDIVRSVFFGTREAP